MFLVVNILCHVMMGCGVKSLVPQIRKTLQNTLVDADGSRGAKLYRITRSCIAMEYLLSKVEGHGRRGCTYDMCGFGLEIPGSTLALKAGISRHLTRQL